MSYNIDTAFLVKVMCAIARRNTWRNGKRDSQLCSRRVFGVYMTLKHKAPRVSITGTGWRIEYNLAFGKTAYKKRSKALQRKINKGVQVSSPQLVQPMWSYYETGPLKGASQERHQIPYPMAIPSGRNAPANIRALLVQPVAANGLNMQEAVLNLDTNYDVENARKFEHDMTILRMFTSRLDSVDE